MKTRFSILTIVALICGITAAHAQFGNAFMSYTENKRSINLGAEYEINSDFLSNDFINRFYRGGYIDKSMKDRQLARVSGANVIGGLVNTHLTAFFGKDSSRYRFLVGVNHRQFFNASITADMYKLGFYGNKQFQQQGEPANLGYSQVNNITFQEYKMGFIIDGVDTTRAAMGMSLSYLQGQNFVRLRTNDSQLNTAPDASSISLSTNAELSMSDTAAKKWTDYTGAGMSAEFFAVTPYTSKLGKSKFILSVSNLGFIRWSDQSLNYAADSTFIFSGVNVDNVFDLRDSTLNAIALDSIINNSTSLTRTHTSTNLPVTFLIIHKVRFTKLFELTTGFRHLFNANYKPYLFIESGFYISKTVAASAHIGYGGYGKLSGGLGVNINVKDHFILKLGSNSLQGFIAPKTTLGQSAYCTISYKF
jgi:hypothetical protein